jgi:hypothetical protein|tara:strand:- start:274 stop:543 length:270 start_codon:yes stop_codon:yes gene_type:complete
MSWYEDKATELQRQVRWAEIDTKAGVNEYSESDVNLATVHMREDIVLLVSYLSSLNSQVRTIKWFIGVGVLVYIFTLPFWQSIRLLFSI